MKFKKTYIIFMIPIIALIALFFMPDKSSSREVVRNDDYTSNSLLYVSVIGEVRSPGYYYLKDGSTFLDLLNKCGKTDYTVSDVKNINEKLVNGMNYEVSIVTNNEKGVTVSLNTSAVKPTEKIDNGLININEASINDLIMLSGIGTVKANAIINYRKSKKFTSKDELLNVEGITENIYESIKNYITV